MSQSAFITFVEGSAVSSVTLEELKEQLLRYRHQTSLTGEQLGWEYADAAFPYAIESKPEQEEHWFYLKGTSPRYHYIVFGTGTKEGDPPRSHVQVVLPDGATHGDKSKGNELCKCLAKKWKAELTLFNGRTMYFNPRK